MSSDSPTAVIFSGDAAAKVRDLLAEEGNPNLMLRVSVAGGGCSGFQYGFAFQELREAEDLVIEKDGVLILIDPVSLQYLRGAHIDYEEGAGGSRFVIKNPNAKSTCGCGSSFSTTESGNTDGNTADGKSCASRTPVDR